MGKLLLELVMVVPAVVEVVRDTIDAVEAATDQETRLKAIAEGFERLAATIKNAL